MFTALDAGQIQAVMLDTAIVLGQAAASNGRLEVAAQYKTGESYGGLIESGTKNLGFINQYIDTLKSDGTLDQLNTEYLDAQLADSRRAGQRLAFRVMCCSSGPGHPYQPAWLAKEGGREVPCSYGQTTGLLVPDFDGRETRRAPGQQHVNRYVRPGIFGERVPQVRAEYPECAHVARRGQMAQKRLDRRVLRCVFQHICQYIQRYRNHAFAPLRSHATCSSSLSSVY